MRYIDLDLLVGRQDAQALMDAAEAARTTVKEIDDVGTRRSVITANRDKWVAFRALFEDLFGRKCWYTESRNPGTDDDIDHYRPKGRLADNPEHGGYWWEALNWRNFRLSSHRANRLRENPDTGEVQGKGDRFPLLDEADRWYGPIETCREHPALLDPTDPADPPLLTFDSDGRSALSPSFADDPDAARRVEASRLYLHLDWPAFVSDRRDLYVAVLLKVLDGDKADAAFRRSEPGGRDSLKSIARDLIRLTEHRAAYSRAAIAYIARFRDRDWVKRYVLSNIPATP